MQSHAAFCTPEKLRRLQNVFDAVWFELEQQKSSHTFPWTIEATRYTIAQLVLQHTTNETDAERIKSEVLQTLHQATSEQQMRALTSPAAERLP